MCAAARCPQTPAPLNLLDYFFWHHSASPAAFLHLMELPLVLEIIQLTDVESCSCSPALQTPLLFGLLFLSIAELCKKTPSMHTCGNVLLVLGESRILFPFLRYFFPPFLRNDAGLVTYYSRSNRVDRVLPWKANMAFISYFNDLLSTV